MYRDVTSSDFYEYANKNCIEMPFLFSIQKFSFGRIFTRTDKVIDTKIFVPHIFTRTDKVLDTFLPPLSDTNYLFPTITQKSVNL